jgi:transposase
MQVQPSTSTTWVGLDVHMSSISAAATLGQTGELIRARFSGDPDEAVEWVKRLSGERKRVTYEAGPCGFILARKLRLAGIEVLVCAPGLVPRAPRDKIKTDRRDAELLMRCLMSGQLAEVNVPSVEHEGLPCPTPQRRSPSSTGSVCTSTCSSAARPWRRSCLRASSRASGPRPPSGCAVCAGSTA